MVFFSFSCKFFLTHYFYDTRSLLGCLFPIPRILYAMSSDGLLFKCLSKVNEKTKTPVLATMICGIGTGKEFKVLSAMKYFFFY